MHSECSLHLCKQFNEMFAILIVFELIYDSVLQQFRTLSDCVVSACCDSEIAVIEACCTMLKTRDLDIE